MKEFAPRLDILPPPQRTLWGELEATPKEFTLYGGTAIALQLGHRWSVDFDFFSPQSFDPDAVKKQVPYLANGETTQRAEGTLSVRVNRNGWVFLSFFHTPHITPLSPALTAPDNRIKIAALIDLAGLKADVVQRRAQAKDFLDLDALLSSGISLVEAIAAAKIIQGDDYTPEITIKALSYFGDGDLPKLDRAVKKRLQRAVQEVDLHDAPKAQAALLAKYRSGKT